MEGQPKAPQTREEQLQDLLKKHEEDHGKVPEEDKPGLLKIWSDAMNEADSDKAAAAEEADDSEQKQIDLKADLEEDEALRDKK